GRLSNHQALSALALERVSQILGERAWDGAIDERVSRVLSWQSSEGWFQEYEGCDPGYHTLTLASLASLYEIRPEERLHSALNKGGVFRLFREGRLAASDTQVSLQVRTGRGIRNAVGHLVDDYEVHVEEDEISVRGTFGWAKQKRMTPWSLLVLRGVMLTFG